MPKILYTFVKTWLFFHVTSGQHFLLEYKYMCHIKKQNWVNIVSWGLIYWINEVLHLSQRYFTYIETSPAIGSRRENDICLQPGTMTRSYSREKWLNLTVGRILRNTISLKQFFNGLYNDLFKCINWYHLGVD